MSSLSQWNDTIAAIATAQGTGAIAVLRVSGSNAIDIMKKIFPSKDLSTVPSHSIHVGMIQEGDVQIDEVVVSIFIAPRSYTGENVVEISCHGSMHIQQKILELLVSNGARLAKPGEFTQRAFLQGKMDLTQAEAVADLIAGNAEAARRTALQNMKGGFSNDLAVVRDQLIKFSALIELELDFSQEDVEFADRSSLIKLLHEARIIVDHLLESFSLGNAIKNGVQVAIIGKPNVGKSTLLNALLNDDRAIVSEIAGTTRDTIEEMLNINGVLFRLIDTAGIRNHTEDVIEKIGVAKSLEKMRKADIVMYLFDVNETELEFLKESIIQMRSENIRYILVGNKADDEQVNYNQKVAVAGELIQFISAKDKLNIEGLKQHLFSETIGKTSFEDQTIITNARHATALQKVKESLIEILDGIQNNLPGDLLSSHINQSLFYIGEITGTITNEDQLDYIFSKFCIGK